jgi:predicted amidohydrolase
MKNIFSTVIILTIGVFGFQFLMGNPSSLNHAEYVRIAGIILKWIPKEPEKNFERVVKLIREASSKGAKIVCTTESFLDGYSIRDNNLTIEEFRLLAEPIPEGKYITKLQQLVAELDIYLIAGLSELSGEKIFNSAVLIDTTGIILGIYRKKYLWGYENKKYSAGDIFPVFETKFGKLGMMICYDRHKTESIMELKENGAEIVFCLAGGGFGSENDNVVSQRSKESKIPIVFVHPIEFLVTGSTGEILEQSLFGRTLDESVNESYGGVIRLFDLNILRKSER